MKALVAYIDDAYAPSVTKLRRLLGDDFRPGPLPYVTSSVETIGDLEQRVRRIDELAGCSPGSAVLVQDAVLKTQMSEQHALECVKRDKEWVTFLRNWEVTEDRVSIKTSESDRCWVVLAENVGGGMPPGLIFLVDKATERVFTRRYVDLVYLFHPAASSP